MATEPRLLTSDLFVSLEHVRRSVLRLAIVFAVASAVAYPFVPHLLHFLARPLGTPLIMYAPLEGFMSYVTISMTTSVCLVAPLLLYEVHRLLRAVCGLHPRVALGSAVAAGGLFALGAGFCYVVILPVTLRFLLGFGGENIEAGIRAGIGEVLQLGAQHRIGQRTGRIDAFPGRVGLQPHGGVFGVFFFGEVEQAFDGFAQRGFLPQHGGHRTQG